MNEPTRELRVSVDDRNIREDTSYRQLSLFLTSDIDVKIVYMANSDKIAPRYL